MSKHKRRFLQHAMNVVMQENTPKPASGSTRVDSLESGIYAAAQDPFDDASGDVAESARRVAAQVTLIVYGWQNVEPGTLAWVFPNYDAALVAARAMRNAVRWAIVAGKRTENLDEAHDLGAVLSEQG